MAPQMQNLELIMQNDPYAKKTEGEIWNILVQILLPLVLLLTFVVVQQILTYKKSYDDLIGRLDLEHIPSFVFQRKIVEIQFQKLLVALEKVKHEEIINLNISMFSDTSVIRRKGINLLDAEFKNFCDASKKVFEESLKQRRYVDSLYSRVLDHAQIKDDAFMSPVKPCRCLDPVVVEGDTASARPNKITLQNRCKIHQMLIDFAAGLEKNINSIQLDLVRHLFDEISPNTDGLPPSTKKLAVRIINETSEEDRRHYAVLFHKKATSWVKKQLSNNGYHFLNSSWRKVESI